MMLIQNAHALPTERVCVSAPKYRTETFRCDFNLKPETEKTLRTTHAFHSASLAAVRAGGALPRCTARSAPQVLIQDGRHSATIELRG